MTEAQALDAEIASLRARADALKHQLSLQATHLLTTPHTQSLLSSFSTTATTTSLNPTQLSALRTRLQTQLAHNQQSLYRICAATTTFLVHDPDPQAVDNGTTLGLRIDVMTRRKFLPQPYYVFFNRPYAEPSVGASDSDGGEARRKERRRYLRVHRHTIPSCVGVAALAARYLPPPAKQPAGTIHPTQSAPGKTQDLPRFVRALRKQLIRYHNRDAIIRELRRALGLNDSSTPTAAEDRAKRRREESGMKEIVAVTAADAEMKHVAVEWADGRVGRLVVGDDGLVEKFVVLGGEGGREYGFEREVLGDGSGRGVRLEDVARRLAVV